MSKMLEPMIVSVDTLKASDLVPKFYSALSTVNPVQAEEIKMEYCDLFKLLDHTDNSPMESDEVKEYSEGFGYLLESLHEALNEHCAPFCYFGTSEGDGACFGVFFCWDSWHEALENEEAILYFNEDEMEWKHDIETYQYIAFGTSDSFKLYKVDCAALMNLFHVD